MMKQLLTCLRKKTIVAFLIQVEAVFSSKYLKVTRVVEINLKVTRVVEIKEYLQIAQFGNNKFI